MISAVFPPVPVFFLPSCLPSFSFVFPSFYLDEMEMTNQATNKDGLQEVESKKARKQESKKARKQERLNG
jgi:hypothetical protein